MKPIACLCGLPECVNSETEGHKDQSMRDWVACHVLGLVGRYNMTTDNLEHIAENVKTAFDYADQFMAERRRRTLK